VIEETKETKPRRKLLLMAVSIATIAALALPMAVMAQENGYPDMDGFGYLFRAPRWLSDIDGQREASPYQGMALIVTSQNDEVIQGLLLGVNVTRIRRAVATSDTAEIDARRGAVRLREGINEFAVLDDGTINVWLPEGVIGYATAANMTPAAVALDSGDNTLTFTDADDEVIVDIYSDTVVLAEVAGVIGTGRRAQILITGPRMVTFLDDTGDYTATIDGLTLEDDLHRVSPPGGAYSVSVLGTFGYYMPYGCHGTLTTSGGMEIDGGTEIEMEPGVWETAEVGEATGNLHVNVSTTGWFQLTGGIRVRGGDVLGIRGNLSGFLVTDTEPWSVATVNSRVGARVWDYCLEG